jgi:DNA-binding HxlR family transcriptional regulator
MGAAHHVELSDGPLGARALLARCEGLSSSVMYERLRELTDAGLVGRHDASAYELTSLGRKLNRAIAPLDGWARGPGRTHPPTSALVTGGPGAPGYSAGRRMTST